ncbi:phosphoribosylanthranilate isomerase [candidate division KSB1 bacterium]|nr:phosphoribosylanthranilate isomerase [candidate division KSB1 bacterium]NIR73341.1 phosphoribosylanthranilate isomerase [candidate division KSB1 bacterium]NIS27047.1 phosphoribosylanthranilate isomerase [candidate division KSB1 bacterium]NIT73887.1 phosphoribosylanthranilate isomerase [candidate division KSB1 bacterium]NIU27792.1 phosphoribosylanthranilate isomerase [candidate division KSB1 bacterium]
MRPIKTPRVKICCIQSVEEAWLAIKHGASALGLVSEMPSGPGVIPEELIAEISVTAPPGVATFLLTSKTNTDSIIEQQKRCRVNTLQLVDRLETGTYEDLRDALIGISIVQVIHVTGKESVKEAEAIAPHVNAILLDSGNPNLKVKELGGTGRVHDWQFSKMIRERVDVPIYLAGGLKPGNVADAIRKVGPFGLDICNGVRTGGKLDETKLDAFFTEVGTDAKL